MMLRDRQNAVLFGVCAGIGRQYAVDPLWVRLAFVAAFLGFGAGILLYLLLAILMD